jgi:heme exporter protein B
MAGLYGLAVVVALAVGTLNHSVSGGLASGLLWSALVFANAVSLPRTFTSEEDQGTADLLRVYARPHAVYWGKALFNVCQCVLTNLTLTMIVLLMLSLSVRSAWLLVVSVISGSIALAGAVTLCGALAMPSRQRANLSAAIALPLILPLVAFGVGATRPSLGTGAMETGWTLSFGLFCYGVLTLAVGPYLLAAVWKDR